MKNASLTHQSSGPPSSPPHRQDDSPSATSRLRSAYLAECASRGCPPIAPLVDALDAHVQVASDEVRYVRLNGNSSRLFENRVTDAQAVALAHALCVESDAPVRDLDLSYNRIGDADAAALAEMCAANAHVESLNLRGNEIGPEGCAKIADVLARATRGRASVSSDVRRENATTGAGGALKENEAPDDDALGGAPTGGAKTRLRFLDLAHNPLDNDGGAALAGALRANATLTHLDLERTDLGLRALSALCGAVNESNDTLEYLSLESPREFSVADEHAWPAARALGANARLKTLKCGKWGLKHEGLETIVAYGLCANQTLETLDLRCNRVDELGGAHVARALRENKTLRALNLEENELGDAGAASVAAALGETACLTRLDLRCNGISERGLVALADGVRAMLENDAPPSELRLWGNDFGPPGSAAATAWRDVFARAEALGATIKADITFRVVDGEVHVARMTEIGTKEVGNRF